MSRRPGSSAQCRKLYRTQYWTGGRNKRRLCRCNCRHRYYPWLRTLRDRCEALLLRPALCRFPASRRCRKSRRIPCRPCRSNTRRASNSSRPRNRRSRFGRSVPACSCTRPWRRRCQHRRLDRPGS
jgi:hypothetical protein